MADDSKRPLFQRSRSTREAVNMKASEGGKRFNTGLQASVFTGEAALNNPLGTYWPDLAQSGALVLSEGTDAEVGGCDQVKITADGSGITVPGAWVNVGTDEIDTTAAAVNRLIIVKTQTEIQYVNKVEA